MHFISTSIQHCMAGPSQYSQARKKIPQALKWKKQNLVCAIVMISCKEKKIYIEMIETTKGPG